MNLPTRVALEDRIPQMKVPKRRPGKKTRREESESEMTCNRGQPVDRRASIRRDVRVPMNIRPPNISSVISGRIQDISHGGMKVRTEITPPIGISDKVMLLVNQPYFKFEGQGEILWASLKGGTVGIKFTRLNREARRSLDEFLSLFACVPTNNH